VPPAETDIRPSDGVDTSVIVVTHESVREIEPCLTSLQEHADCDYEVIVVDNASTDGTPELIERRFPWVRILRAPKRRGFAANCNDGARIALGESLFFLNPDARVTAGAIDELLATLDSDPSVAIVGPRLVYPDGSPQPSARRFPTVRGTIIRRTPLRWALRHSKAESRHLMLVGQRSASQEPIRVDWLLGAAIAMRAEVYRRLGGMDDGYRLYCEDIDLCWRAWESGLKVVQAQSAVVEHDLSELTRRRFLTRATIWHFKSMARFVARHGLQSPRLARAE